MRRQVPFIGERKLVRADDEQARIKRINGRVIDDVVGEGVALSSWEDVVGDGWVNRPPSEPKPPTSGSVARPPTSPQFKVPIRSGTITIAVAKVPNPANGAGKALQTGVIGLPNSSLIDWMLIQNGRGARVNIHGAIDSHLRKEWARLLAGTEDMSIEEFEFNLSDSPALSLTGLAMLLLFRDKKRSVCKVFSLCNCTKEVAQLLEWTGMDRYFLIKKTQISKQS